MRNIIRFCGIALLFFYQISLAQIDREWKNLGPFAKSSNSNNGRMEQIVFHPNYGLNGNETIYAASWMGGLWKSIDGGNNWLPTSSEFNLPSSAISTIAIHPNAPEAIFLATGTRENVNNLLWETNSWKTGIIYTKGVFWSDTGGDHWNNATGNLLTLFNNPAVIRKIIFDPSDSTHLYTVTSEGIFHTHNATSISPPTWVKLFSGNEEEWMGINFKPLEENIPLSQKIMYASATDVYKSTDGGSTWSSMGLKNLIEERGVTVSRINITVSPDKANRVYAHAVVWRDNLQNPKKSQYEVYDIIYNNGEWHFIFLDNETGASYAKRPNRVPMVVSPINGNIMYIGFTMLVGNINIQPLLDLSSDADNKILGNFSYRAYRTFKMHPDIVSFQFEPNTNTPRLWVTTDGGISVINDPTTFPINDERITLKEHGLSVKTIWAMGDDISSDDFIGIGNQDTGTDVFHKEMGTDWKYNIRGGDGYQAKINAVNRWFIGKVNSQKEFVYSPSGDGKEFPFPLNIGAPMILDPVTSRMIWGVSHEIVGYEYNSTGGDENAGEYNTKDMSIVDHPEDHGDFLSFRKVTQCFTHPSTIYASTQCKFAHNSVNWHRNIDDFYTLLYKRTPKSCPNNEDCFINITENLRSAIEIAGLNSLFKEKDLPAITGLKVHPSNPDKVWVTFSGPGTATGIWTTNDGGTTWLNDDDNNQTLQNIPINGITHQLVNGVDIIYLATDFGVYFREGNNGLWAPYGNFPTVRVTEISINYCANKLRVGTFGRGVWEGNLAQTHTGFDYDIVINSSSFINHNFIAQSNIVLKSGVKMSINGTFKMLPQTKLLIEPNAKLLIENGEIEFCRTCGNNNNNQITVFGELHIKKASFKNLSHYQLIIKDGGKVIVDSINGDYCFYKQLPAIIYETENSMLKIENIQITDNLNLPFPTPNSIIRSSSQSAYALVDVSTSGSFSTNGSVHYIAPKIILKPGFSGHNQFRAKSIDNDCSNVTDPCYEESPLIMIRNQARVNNDQSKDYTSFYKKQIKTIGDNKSNLITLYPNPTYGKLFIEGHEIEILELVNNAGKVLIKKTNLTTKNELDMSSYKKGRYIVRCFKKGKWISQRIIIKSN